MANEVSKLIDRTITEVEFDNTITSIGDVAFYTCSSLISVTIPSWITSIGNYAFSDCSSLSSVTCLATTPPTIGQYGVFNNTNNCPIYVPAASVDAYKAASTWADYKSRIVGVADGAANWVQTSYSCEIDTQTGKKTGNAQVTEMDNNPTSSTYGQTRTVTVQDFALCQTAFVAVTDVSQVTTGKYLVVGENDTKALDASLIASTTANNNGINASTNYATIEYNEYGRIVANATSLNAAMEYDATNQKLSWTDPNTGTKYYLNGVGYGSSRRNFNFTDTTTMPSENITVYEEGGSIYFQGVSGTRKIYLEETTDGAFGWSRSRYEVELYKLEE